MYVYIITPPLKCRNYSGGGGGKTARMRSGRQLKETVLEAQAGGCACELAAVMTTYMRPGKVKLDQTLA